MKKPWNKGVRVGRKLPFTPEQVALIRGLLHQQGRLRDVALFSFAIDSGLRGCDALPLRVSDVCGFDGGCKSVVSLTQRKTGEQVTFHISERTQAALAAWVEASGKQSADYLFTGQKGCWQSKPISEKSYGLLVKKWASSIGLNPASYGMHSLRRTQSSHIYNQTGNLRAVQILLGHSDIRNTALYLGIEEAEALIIAEKYHL